MNTMKKTLSALAAVLALAASGMEWSFDGPEPLRSEDGKTVLTGSVTVAEKAGITGNALRFDGKTDFLELALTGDNRPRGSDALFLGPAGGGLHGAADRAFSAA